MQLNDIKVGHHYRITKVNSGDLVYRQRLIAMGLIPGAEFYVSRIAPLGDPVEIHIRGYSLSLRKSEASILQIEKMELA